MSEVVEELADRWKQSQDADSTIQLCEALSPKQPTLVQQVADFAQAQFASNVPVLVAVARLYMRTSKLADAQTILVAAGKIAPRDGYVYRVLGEVLLRRGDADRAEKVLERAVQFGVRDDGWLERARGFKAMQSKAGARAVAAEVARIAPIDENFEEPATMVRSNPMSPPSPMAPVAAAVDRRYPMNAPTVDIGSFAGNDGVTVTAKSAPPLPVAPRTEPLAVQEPPRASPFRKAEMPGVPDARDVLDALALAGIFESSPTTAMKWDRAPRSRRRGTLPLVAITLVLVGGGIGGFRYIKGERDKAHTQAEEMLAKVESDMQKGDAALLPPLEQQFSQVFDLDSRSTRVALDWLRERALTGLLRGGGDVAFEDGLSRARELKMEDKSLVFAQVASFLFQGDTVGAAGLLSKNDTPCKDDAWYQLLAGATLERAGSGGAKERYEAAVKLDPNLFVAQVGLVRSTAIDGDPAEAMKLAKDFRAKYHDRPESAALVSLAWARDPARSEQAPVESAELATTGGSLPIGLKFVPNAVAALQAIDKHDMATAQSEIQKGLATVEGPGPASWFGILALESGDEALAQKAAIAAVGFSAIYPPARVLAARVALIGNRLDEALKATEDLDATSADVAVVRAATAYERVDATGLSNALDAISADARALPFMEALSVAPAALAGHAPIANDAAKILDMSDDEAPWADLVAMDLALDGGDVATAGKIAEKWKGSESRPLRALRLARLARYTNHLDDADALSQAALIGTITPRTLLERVTVLVAREKAPQASQLLARYPLVLGSLAGWLGAYVSASAGKVEDARGKTASLEPPPVAAPVPARVIAAIALGAMKDHRRGPDVVHDLLASGIINPDTVAAANVLGVRVPEMRRRR